MITPYFPTVNPCTSGPCQNGGTCEAIYALTAAGYHCICEPGYVGLYCQTFVLSSELSMANITMINPGD